MPTARHAVLASARIAFAWGLLCLVTSGAAVAAPAVACPASIGLVVAGAEPETAARLEQSLDHRDLSTAGQTWVGRLATVGEGRRDTIVFIPSTLDPRRPIELVVFMDGYGSFAPARIDGRHGAAIQRIVDERRNAVYVAPDAPSSTYGNRTQRGAYWQAGCDGRGKCRGGHGAPGDFVAFVRAITDMVRGALCVDDIELRLALVGFSAGGRGVHDAVAQLAASREDIRIDTVGLTELVFADALYGDWWLTKTWARARHLPTLRSVLLLLQDGPFVGRVDTRPGGANRSRAWRFAHPRRGTPDDRIRIRVVPGDHHAVGDAATGFLGTAPGSV